MEKLYICEYPYNLYKLLIERMQNNQDRYSLILTDSIANFDPMVSILQQSNLFEKVEFFPCELYKEYYQLFMFDSPKSQLINFLMRLKNNVLLLVHQTKLKKIKFPFDINFNQYDKIVCNDFACVINGYLTMNHINYSISEHSKNCYSYMVGMVGNVYDMYLCLLNVLDKINIVNGKPPASKYCEEIIVNNKTKMPRCLRHKKIVEWNVDDNIAALSVEQKDKIFQLYANAYNLHIDPECTYDLLLTNPLFHDGFVESEEKQIKFYSDIIGKYLNFPVLIKPHPRDTVDYKKYFSDCLLIDQNISSELLVFSQHLKLSKVLTLHSTSIDTFKSKANKLIRLEDPSTPSSQMASLKGYR